MSFFRTLAVVCSVLNIGLLFPLVKFDVDNEFVTFCAPMGFLSAITYACLYLDEKRKPPSEKKPLEGFMMVLHYFLLGGFILGVGASLFMAGIEDSFLPLITGLTFFSALSAVFFYVEEKRKGASIEKGEKQPTENHG